MRTIDGYLSLIYEAYEQLITYLAESQQCEQTCVAADVAYEMLLYSGSEANCCAPCCSHLELAYSQTSARADQ